MSRGLWANLGEESSKPFGYNRASDSGLLGTFLALFSLLEQFISFLIFVSLEA